MILFLKGKILGALSWLSLALGVLFMAYYKGRTAGASSEKQKVVESIDKAKELRKEVDTDVENANDADIDGRGSRWVRKQP